MVGPGEYLYPQNHQFEARDSNVPSLFGSQFLKEIDRLKISHPQDEKNINIIQRRVEHLTTENKSLQDLVANFTKNQNSLPHKDLLLIEFEAKWKAVVHENEKTSRLHQ